MAGGNEVSTKTSLKRQKRTSAWTCISSGDTERNKKLTATLLDLDVTDCSVCYDTPTFPIFQCDNGHIVCSTCCQKLRRKCATCSLPTLSRNRAIERVLEQLRVPCPNAGFGCSKDVSYDERSIHMLLCAFTPCRCPFNSCNFRGSYKDLYEHSIAEHLESLYMFECGKPEFLHPKSDKRVVLKEKTTEEGGGELVVVECFNILHGQIISASCIAPVFTSIGEFSYSLNLCASGGDRLCFESKAKKVQEVSGEPPDEHFMLVPSYICPDYKLNICINRKT